VFCLHIIELLNNNILVPWMTRVEQEHNEVSGAKVESTSLKGLSGKE
jgi:hypothetical protein